MPKNDGTIIALIPANFDAASIEVHANDGADYVDFSFEERGATWELPLEGRYENADSAQLLAEVEEMCRALSPGIAIRVAGHSGSPAGLT